MKIKFFKKIRSSLFSKILLVFIISFALISVFSIFSHRIIFRGPRLARVPRIFIGYSRLVVNDLPEPIDTMKAATMADSLGLRMRIETPQYTWASRKEMPGFNQLIYEREYQIDQNTEAAFLKKRWGIAIHIKREDARFLFLFGSEREAFTSAAFLQTILLISFSTVIIIVVYFFINWFLKPIKKLHEGVEQIGEGNLDFKIRTNRSDELGQLGDSFNSMTQRIKEMIRARDQLLLDVSHELRSPLTRMKVALEFMEDSTAKKSMQDDIIETETMVTELLETERLKSQYGGLHRQELNISALLREVCREFHGQKPGIKLADIPSEVMLLADRERLKIVFKNIVSNAIKFSGASEQPVQIKLEQGVETVTITVRDYGSGIPKSEMPYLFEPFFRVDKSRSKETGGYGLGLNLSKKIMEAHGGSIEIKSELKVGTTVYLKFRKK
jgi:signal transduction histidine kinase